MEGNALEDGDALAAERKRARQIDGSIAGLPLGCMVRSASESKEVVCTTHPSGIYFRFGRALVT
jgi:hypothetical protein